MQQIARRFSVGNLWAIDSTFKTNLYDLPLYAAIVPNQDGRGMPVFYMLCSKDKEKGHEGIAMKITLQYVFASIEGVRLSTIVIDKSPTSLSAIRTIVEKHPFCLKNDIIGGEQIAGWIFLCHFHMMKIWRENLLTCIPIDEKDKVWQHLHVLMHYP